MKRSFFALLLGAAACSALAQAPATPQPAALAPATQPAAQARQQQQFVGLNEKEGVDVDRFIGRPTNSPVHFTHGTILTQQILGPGDPYHPGPNSDVLEYRKLLSTAELQAGAETPLQAYPDSYFFYVESGEARLDDGKQYWDLKPGFAILAPPNVAHRLVNSTDKPLEMIMLQWTAGPAAKNSLIVRNTLQLPWCEENAHWNNYSHCILSASDGLLQGERIYTVMLPPWVSSQPHSHTPGTEEVWTKISIGVSPILIGSDLREAEQNTAYLVPPTGKTDHSNLNLSKTEPQWWLYIARGPDRPANANAPARPQGTNPAFAANPNLSRDTTAATVAGKPLPK